MASGNDILNRDMLQSVMASCKFDVVVHLAAVADLNIMRADPEKVRLFVYV